MKIFFATDTIPTRLGSTYKLNTHGGFGHAHECIKKELINKGIVPVDDPNDADIEFLCSPPDGKIRPDMSPSSTLTMWESSKLPDFFRGAINSYDHICNPSEWGKQLFINSGIYKPIDVVPLGINTDKFQYINRCRTDAFGNNRPWTFYVQCIQLLDRKNAFKCLQIFIINQKKLPKDWLLIIKSIPCLNIDGTVIDLWLTSQVHFIEKSLSFDDLLGLHAMSNVSINPTSGEGWGLIPLECMATGMATIVTNYSGVCQWANPEYMFLLDYKEVPCPLVETSTWAEPDMDQCLKYMLWTYEHQDEAMLLGKRASEWARKTWTYDKTAEILIGIFENLIKTIPKKVDAWQLSDPPEKWFNMNRLLNRAPKATEI